MRVTQSMLATNTLKHITLGYENLGRLQDQLASGKKITRAHQDPVVAMKGMRYRTEVTEVEQFMRNLSEVYNWMDNADSALDKVTQSIHRVRELVVQASNDSYNATQRANMAKEIRQLTEHIASLANTQISGKYIFNGTDTTTPPVDLEKVDLDISNFNSNEAENYTIQYEGKQFLYDHEVGAFVHGETAIAIREEAGDTIIEMQVGEEAPVVLAREDIILSHKDGISTNTEDVKIEVMKNITMAVNIRPQNVFTPELFKQLNEIADMLENEDIEGKDITPILDKLDAYTDNFVSERAELGARVNRVEMIEQRVREQEVIANRILTENEDADLERVIIDLISQESVHRAALSAGARIIQPTLLDFLR